MEKNKYFYLNDLEYDSYLKLPKALIYNKKFKNVELEIKILYSIMLNRQLISLKNDWKDEKQRVYIIFKVDEIMDIFNIGKEKTSKILKKMEEIGMIERKKVGFGKPTLFYVKKIDLTNDKGEKDYVDSEKFGYDIV